MQRQEPKANPKPPSTRSQDPHSTAYTAAAASPTILLLLPSIPPRSSHRLIPGPTPPAGPPLSHAESPALAPSPSPPSVSPRSTWQPSSSTRTTGPISSPKSLVLGRFEAIPSGPPSLYLLLRQLLRDLRTVQNTLRSLWLRRGARTVGCWRGVGW